MVAISYDKGVIECHKCDDLNSSYFALFVNDKFDDMFAKADKNGSRLSIQDNAPNQNSALVRRMLRIKRAKQLFIPSRSADINCIENFFHRKKGAKKAGASILKISPMRYSKNSRHA